MSTPSDPQTPAPGTGFAQPDTAEIPVVAPAAARTTVQQLPPPSSPRAGSESTSASGATSASAAPSASVPQPDPATAPQPTGPVDFVPGPPGAGSPAPPAQPATSSWPEILEAGESADEAAATKQPRAPRDRTALAGAGLVALALVLLQLGLALAFGTGSFWSAIPLWSAFATGCVLLGLAGFAGLVPTGRRLGERTGRRIAAGGLAGLAVFWVLVVLPNADTDRGFLHTAALAALGGAVWLATGRADRTAAG
ncbi:hypothetical protein [Blastococcus sp. VKM Ac-2987]|uniref:hypothetical protein n=1 Tax=Blastococcus sp. VKM Ac-2987 TaxID=3004141 RepID=UPI0022ABBEE2|nr:hypothetical protein [Blastococcus sp. VKM Ac-2987]MCZ2858757.1 hypothetical protein [Blastococcus sp. VKM Ac-2987]